MSTTEIITKEDIDRRTANNLEEGDKIRDGQDTLTVKEVEYGPFPVMDADAIITCETVVGGDTALPIRFD